MCGRYALAQEHETLRARFGFVEGPSETFTPRYNIAPAQMNPVIVEDEQRALRPMRWGFIPPWARESSIGNRMINAKAETAHAKPSFRDSFRHRRCLVPATGFFEWKPIEGARSKQPILITLTDQDLFAFAGLWSRWRGPSGQEIESYAILTTEPNALMKSIHHRMPVILTRDNEDRWLAPGGTPNDLRRLLQPYPVDRMRAVPVSTIVNSPANDSPECIVPI